jgi:hypothetical protein
VQIKELVQLQLKVEVQGAVVLAVILLEERVIKADIVQ